MDGRSQRFQSLPKELYALCRVSHERRPGIFCWGGNTDSNSDECRWAALKYLERAGYITMKKLLPSSGMASGSQIWHSAIDMRCYLQ